MEEQNMGAQSLTIRISSVGGDLEDLMNSIQNEIGRIVDKTEAYSKKHQSVCMQFCMEDGSEKLSGIIACGKKVVGGKAKRKSA